MPTMLSRRKAMDLMVKANQRKNRFPCPPENTLRPVRARRRNGSGNPSARHTFSTLSWSRKFSLSARNTAVRGALITLASLDPPNMQDPTARRTSGSDTKMTLYGWALKPVGARIVTSASSRTTSGAMWSDLNARQLERFLTKEENILAVEGSPLVVVGFTLKGNAAAGLGLGLGLGSFLVAVVKGLSTLADELFVLSFPFSILVLSLLPSIVRSYEASFIAAWMEVAVALVVVCTFWRNFFSVFCTPATDAAARGLI
mmetsp:Transcript_10514/g.15678  ORF Transcript_10514/g.15678 Transcript_10514/m.15678 type:complete len:258 (-) Transcript_10514:171-944(-)